MRRPAAKQPARMRTYVLLLVCVIMLMISLRWCSTPPKGSSKIAVASQGDTIDVAISYSPMTLYRYADTLGGFSYDMLNMMAADNGLTLKFHPVTSVEKALLLLRDGIYDLVVTDMARTSELDTTFVYTPDIYLDRQVLVQLLSDSNDSSVYITNQLELGGKRVLVEASSPAYWRLRNLSGEIGDTIKIEADDAYTSEQLFLAVAVGEASYAVVNESVARMLAKDYPNVDISTAISFTQFQAWVMRRNDTTQRALIDSAIVGFKDSPSYSSLVSRYGIEQ